MRGSNKMILKKIKRGFRRKVLDYDNVVKTYYIDNNLAFISCNVSRYDEIISKHSVSGYEWLDPEFAMFIEDNANNIPIEYPIVLDICGLSLRDDQEEIIRNVVRSYYVLKYGDIQQKLSSNWRKLLLDMLLGAGYLLLSSLLSIDQTTLFAQTGVVFFWFMLWDALDSLFVWRNLLDERSYMAQLAEMKIRFLENYKEIPISQAVTMKIISDVIENEELG